MSEPPSERDKAKKELSPSKEAHALFKHDVPLDEPQKSYHTILEQQISQAREELGRGAAALLISAVSAGMDVGFGPFAMTVVASKAKDLWPAPIIDLVTANLYAVGFIFVVLGRSALFTEHTTAAVLPVLARRASIGRLLRLWALVLFGNIVGAAVFSALAVLVGPALGVVEREAFGELAHEAAGHAGWVILLSAILAGWLMGLLVWLVTAARDTIGQVVMVWLTTFVIGITGLHHSIAGSVEVLMGVFAGHGASLGDFGVFIFWAALGNAIGGVSFVAILKYGHVHQTHR